MRSTTKKKVHILLFPLRILATILDIIFRVLFFIIEFRKYAYTGKFKHKNR